MGHKLEILLKDKGLRFEKCDVVKRRVTEISSHVKTHTESPHFASNMSMFLLNM